MEKQVVLDKVLAPILSNGFQAYIVGGAVRDEVFNKNKKEKGMSFIKDVVINDYDVVTDATPAQLHKIFDNFVDINSEAFGIVVINVEGENVEIATFRKDRECDGRHTEVTFAHSIEEDASRRDFAMNALYEDINGKIYDPTGNGIRDAKAKTPTFIGSAAERCEEDCLRILRWLRFAANGYGSIEVLKDCEDVKKLLKNSKFIERFHERVSPERIGKEMRKLFQSSNFTSLCDTVNFILKYCEPLEILPKELYLMKEQPCATKWHKSKTNLEHSFNAFSSDYIEDADYLLKIATLFHDIGKLSTQDKDFHAREHDIVGANAAKTFLHERWKFTNKECEDVYYLISKHMEIHNLAYTTHLEKLWKFIDETNKKVEFRRQFLLLRADCRDNILEKADDEILLEMPLFAFFRETPYPAVFTGKDFKEKINGAAIGKAINNANKIYASSVINILNGKYEFINKDSIMKNVLNSIK